MKNKYEIIEKYLQEWDLMDEYLFLQIKETWVESAPKLVTFLLERLFLDETFEIGTGHYKQETISHITFDQFHSGEKDLSLFCTQSKNFILYFMVLDDDQKEQVLHYEIPDAELGLIPKGLQNLMIKVVENKQGIEVNPKSLL